jgi:periplasmic protein TonB
MKRNKERVPEFDEIIFENRNKTYGAYDLRKRYKSAASLSILGGIMLSGTIMAALSLSTEPGEASTGPTSVILVMADPVIPDFVKPDVPKPPEVLTKTIMNLKPVITDDTAQATPYVPTAEEIQNSVKNGSVDDTSSYSTPSDPVIPVEPEPRIIVQEMPEFPGGNAALLEYIGENLKYPAEAVDNKIQGKINLKFVVRSDGSVDRIEIVKGVDSLLENEAIRVVKSLPRFKPGKQDGVAVPVWFSLPVTFKIQNN